MKRAIDKVQPLRFPDVQCVTIHEYSDHIHQLGMGNYHISGFIQGNVNKLFH